MLPAMAGGLEVLAGGLAGEEAGQGEWSGMRGLIAMPGLTRSAVGCRLCRGRLMLGRLGQDDHLWLGSRTGDPP
jgi:hypothetical protein